VFQIDHVDTQAQDAGLGANDVKVYFAVKSVWALHWAGFLPIIKKDIWMAANTKYSFGYDDAAGTMTTPNNVRTYHSWTDDANNNGVIDLKEDGGFSWKFVSYTVGETVALTKFADYYDSGADVDAYINTKFHAIGNVNYGGGYGATQGWYTADSAVDLSLDIRAIGMSSGSFDTWTKEYIWSTPIGNKGFNPDADISGAVTVTKHAINGSSIGSINDVHIQWYSTDYQLPMWENKTVPLVPYSIDLKFGTTLEGTVKIETTDGGNTYYITVTAAPGKSVKVNIVELTYNGKRVYTGSGSPFIRTSNGVPDGAVDGFDLGVAGKAFGKSQG
jgi:hypothetical protein